MKYLWYFLVVLLLIILGLYVGLRTTGNVISSEGVSIWIESTDMSTNDTYQNVTCHLDSASPVQDYAARFLVNGKSLPGYYWEKTSPAYSSIALSSQIIVEDNGSYFYYSGTANSDRYIAKINGSNGNVIWENRSGLSGYNDYGSSIASDSFGNVYQLSIKYSGGFVGPSLLKFDNSGNPIFQKIFSDSYYLSTGSVSDYRGVIVHGDNVYFSISNSTSTIIYKYDLDGNQINASIISYPGYLTMYQDDSSIYILFNYKDTVYYDFLEYDQDLNLVSNSSFNNTVTKVNGYDTYYISSENRLYTYVSSDETVVTYDLDDESIDVYDVSSSLFDFIDSFSNTGEKFFLLAHVADESFGGVGIYDFFEFDSLMNILSEKYIATDVIKSNVYVSDKEEIYSFYAGGFPGAFYLHLSYVSPYYFFDEISEDVEVSTYYSDLISPTDNLTCELYKKDGLGYIFDIDVSYYVRDDIFDVDYLGLESDGNDSGMLKFYFNCNLGDCGYVHSKLDVSTGVSYVDNFTKDPYASYTYPECKELGTCDCVSENVCIARGDSYPLINAVTQVPEDNQYSCDANVEGTEWAIGNCDSPGTFGTLFGPDVWDCDPTSYIGVELCLHVLETDDYINLVFNDWGSGMVSPGGGFSYTRDFDYPVPDTVNFSGNFSQEFNLGVGSYELDYDVDYSEEVNLTFNINSYLIDKPKITSSISDNFSLMFSPDETTTDGQVVSEETTSSDVGTTGLYYPSDNDSSNGSDSFSIYPSYVKLILSSEEVSNIKINVYNHLSSDETVGLGIENISSFFSVPYPYVVLPGENALDITVRAKNVSKGNYYGKIIFGSPILKNVDVLIRIVEDTYVDNLSLEKIYLNLNDSVYKKSLDSEGNAIDITTMRVRMDYIDKEKYLGQEMEIDYNIMDVYGSVVYTNINKFIVEDDFEGDVFLDIPLDLDVGEYTVNTELITPDNFRITGNYALSIVDEAGGNFPWIPILIMGILTIGIVIVLDRLSKLKR